MILDKSMIIFIVTGNICIQQPLVILVLPFLDWLHLVKIGIVDDVSKEYDATIFRFEMCTMGVRRKIT
jgi:hypothetical protein